MQSSPPISSSAALEIASLSTPSTTNNTYNINSSTAPITNANTATHNTATLNVTNNYSAADAMLEEKSSSSAPKSSNKNNSSQSSLQQSSLAGFFNRSSNANKPSAPAPSAPPSSNAASLSSSSSQRSRLSTEQKSQRSHNIPPFDPERTAQTNNSFIKRYGSLARVKCIERPSTALHSPPTSAEAFTVCLTPPPATASAHTLQVYKSILSSLLQPGCNRPRGRIVCFSRLLHALGERSRPLATGASPTSVDYQRYIPIRSKSLQIQTQPQQQLVSFTPSYNLTHTLALQHSLYIAVRFSRAAADTTGAHILAALQEDIASSAALSSFLSVTSADEVDWIKLRIRLTDMPSSLTESLEAAGLPPKRFVILNEADGCYDPIGATRFRPVIALPQALLSTAKTVLPKLSHTMTEIYMQPQRFCSCCGKLTHRKKPCDCASKYSLVEQQQARICFHCQRRSVDHSPSERDSDNRCTAERFHPCFLCSQNHSPYQCLLFNPHWEQLFLNSSQPPSHTSAAPTPNARSYASAAAALSAPAEHSSPNQSSLVSPPTNLPSSSERRLADLERRNAQLESTISSLTATIAELKSTIITLTTKLTALTSQVAELEDIDAAINRDSDLSAEEDDTISAQLGSHYGSSSQPWQFPKSKKSKRKRSPHKAVSFTTQPFDNG